MGLNVCISSWSPAAGTAHEQPWAGPSSTGRPRPAPRLTPRTHGPPVLLLGPQHGRLDTVLCHLFMSTGLRCPSPVLGGVEPGLGAHFTVTADGLAVTSDSHGLVTDLRGGPKASPGTFRVGSSTTKGSGRPMALQLSPGSSSTNPVTSSESRAQRCPRPSSFLGSHVHLTCFQTTHVGQLWPLHRPSPRTCAVTHLYLTLRDSAGAPAAGRRNMTHPVSLPWTLSTTDSSHVPSPPPIVLYGLNDERRADSGPRDSALHPAVSSPM